MTDAVGVMSEQRRADAPDPALRPQTIHVFGKLALVTTGRRPGHRAVVELWSGSTLIGIMHEEQGGLISIRLESRVRGPLTIGARELEQAPTAACEQLDPTPQPHSAERERPKGP